MQSLFTNYAFGTLCYINNLLVDYPPVDVYLADLWKPFVSFGAMNDQILWGAIVAGLP